MRRLVAMFGAFVLVWALAQYTYAAGGPNVVQEVTGRRECPKLWDRKVLDGGVPLSDETLNIPEFHDCQRFIVGTGKDRHYDALFAVFAADRLNRLDSVIAEAGDTTLMVPSATIWTDGGKYSALGITGASTCLYMWREAGAWKARTLPASADNQNCTQRRVFYPVREERGELDLSVVPTSFAGLSHADYPAVARWDWDAARGEHYLGIKCGAAWCEIGRKGFTPSPNRDDPGGTPLQRRVVMVKGWYDRQYLATPHGAPVTPSEVEGIITPVPELDGMDDLTAFNQWTRVATVNLLQPSPEYKAKYNWDGRSTMSLCHGTRSNCFGWVRTILLWWTIPRCGAAYGKRWWVRTVASDGSKMERCVYRWDMGTEHHVIGTARFRWLARDETSWKRCTNGCCEVH